MSHPDPLIMLADIARVASEHPEFGKELVQALHQNLIMVEGRQPTIDELRDYVDRVSSLDERTLRRRLDLGPRASGRPRRGRPMEQGATPLATREEPEAKRADRRGVVRGPGRPGWTDELFRARYQEALGRAAPPFTYRSIADHFETLDGNVGADPDYVRRLVKRHGLPPE